LAETALRRGFEHEFRHPRLHV